MKKAIISTILTAAVLAANAAVPVSAQTWVQLSSWAYNEVSSFKKEGMIPQSFDEVSDYTQSITRLQLAELLYSALTYANCSLGTAADERWSRFTDVSSKAANALSENIMVGEPAGYNSFDMPVFEFFPERLLTREETAAIICRAAEEFCPHILSRSTAEKPLDDADISDWARADVYTAMSSGLLVGTGGGNFTPKGTLSIEQAVSVVYRLYKQIPSAPSYDAVHEVQAAEVVLCDYGNGIVKTQSGGKLYLKQNGDVIAEFETDIYSNVFCDVSNGTVYAAAQRLNGKTDVFNVSSKAHLFTISYTVHSTEGGFIYTQSANIGPRTFGLYDYNGNEIFEPQYSLDELETLISNSFEAPKEEYRAPDGVIYYADRSDNSSLYKIDTNGENKQKLSDNSCYDIAYVNGWLYYSVYGEDEDVLYCMRSDGKYEQQVSKNEAYLIDWQYMYAQLAESGVDIYSHYKNVPAYSADGWVYFSENTPEGDGSVIKRIRMHEDGTAETEEIFRTEVRDRGISTEFDVQTQTVYYAGANTAYKNGALYFTQHNDNAPTSLYRFDGKDVKKISGDVKINNYALFGDNEVVMYTKNNDDTMTWYIADSDGANLRLWQDGTQAYNAGLTSQKVQNEPTNRSLGDVWTEEIVYTEESDDKFKISAEITTEFSGYVIEYASYKVIDGVIYVTDSSGKREAIDTVGDAFSNMVRIGDTLYYLKHTNTKNNYSLMKYDLNTRAVRCIGENIEYIKTAPQYKSDKWIMLTDNRGCILRYDIEADRIREIFPGKGIRRYAPMKYIMRTSGMELYKLDTHGDYVKLADNVMFWEYVANGGIARDEHVVDNVYMHFPR